MPSLIAHYLLAKRLKNNLKEKLNENAFFWGAQGPDFLLTHNFLNKKNVRSIKKTGMYLQDLEFNRLLNLLNSYIEEKDSSLLAKSYVKGFLSHYILDSESFDFISCRSKLFKEKSYGEFTLRAARNELKSALDNIVLRYEEGKLPNEIRFKDMIPKDKAVFNFMHKFYLHTLRKNFDKTIKLSEVQEALKGYRMLVLFVDDRFFIKKPCVKFVEKILHKDAFISGFFRNMIEPDYFDFANATHEKWCWPEDSKEIRTDSFIDIYEKSVSKATEVIKSLNF